jgi:hypothetical protein
MKSNWDVPWLEGTLCGRRRREPYLALIITSATLIIFKILFAPLTETVAKILCSHTVYPVQEQSPSKTSHQFVILILTRTLQSYLRSAIPARTTAPKQKDRVTSLNWTYLSNPSRLVLRRSDGQTVRYHEYGTDCLFVKDGVFPNFSDRILLSRR